MNAERDSGYAVSARYDRRSGRLVITMNTDIQVAIPTSKIEGLSEADPEDLRDIEISSSGLGLHWPQLDADVYLPSLLQGIFGSRRWMAAQLGAAGGASRSAAKSATARENGRKGGRPRKTASN
ncbi:DUF2442 domain-containing protein [Neorhizobium alkalisoli]|uniref:Uncharacterized protein DUF2442 n=1 Tax=Neorhizobium alkalisoli TaxID=528178 RepID=A0A561QNG5_9HYPH|nr:DUF2442 domain-containing protein [Neorhizobium alkalisoli]TWF51918.1 uncharacterized protein DUF2442 [Neorhizobium alkalisoli]